MLTPPQGSTASASMIATAPESATYVFLARVGVIGLQAYDSIYSGPLGLFSTADAARDALGRLGARFGWNNLCQRISVRTLDFLFCGAGADRSAKSGRRTVVGTILKV